MKYTILIIITALVGFESVLFAIRTSALKMHIRFLLLAFGGYALILITIFATLFHEPHLAHSAVVFAVPAFVLLFFCKMVKRED